jgi:serine/threonine protein kinase
MTPSDRDLERRLRIDGICDEFESLLQKGDSPRIEDYLKRVDPADQPSLIRELAEVEASVRNGRGEVVSKREILARLSSLAEQTTDWMPLPDDVREEAKETEAPDETARFHGPVRATGQFPSIDGFEILYRLGSGGMGVVYKARQTSLNRTVALKLIRAGQQADEEEVKRFHAEAEAAANLDHPGIVPVHEIGVQDGQYYFAMGFVDGPSLAEKGAENPLLPPRKAAAYIKTVAEAIQFAHSRGVIHRDLKPGNILIDSNGEPKVTDFGLAKRVEADSSLTASGQVLGTPSYMPPEQAAGRIDEVRETADVYSLGATLYALLTGRPPFQSANQLDTLLQVLDQEPVAPRKLNAKIPLDLETVCLRCLEKEREHRYDSAQALAEELQRYLNGEPIKARPISTTERVLRWCRRNPRIAVTSAVAAVLGLVLMIGGPLAALVINHQKNVVSAEKNAANLARVAAENAEEEATEQSELAMETVVVLGRAIQDLLHKVPGEDAKALRIELLNTALSRLQHLSDKGGSTSILSATALRRKGDIYMEAGAFSKALEAYQQCRDVVEASVDDPEYKEKYQRKPHLLWQNLARADDAIGTAHLALRHGDEALRHYQDALAVRRRWLARAQADQQANPDSKRFQDYVQRAEQDIATSLGNLGSWYRANGETEKALANFQDSMRRRREFYEDDRANVLAYRELGGAVRAVGLARKDLGDYEAALDHLNEALALLSTVLKEWIEERGYQGEYKVNTNVAMLHSEIGETHFLSGDAKAAFGPYQEAVNRLSKLHEDNPQHDMIRRAYWKALYGLATCALAETPDAAEVHFAKALEVCTPETVGHMFTLARCHQTEQAEELGEKLAKKYADHSQQLYYVACGYALCAWSASEQGDQDAAVQYAEQAMETLRCSIDKGFKSVDELASNPELDSLRDRPDFSRLIAELTEGATKKGGEESR